MNIIKRFLNKVDKQDLNACWNWIGCLNRGYGQFWLKNKSELAHRVSWAIAHRTWPIPNGLQINHTCDNKSCVNPAHLYLGTQANNMQDWSNLKPENIKEIKHLYVQGYSLNELGDKFDVHSSTICKICSNQRWKGV